MKIYLAPAAATVGLLAFWMFALLRPVSLGPTAHGAGGQSSAFWFNVLLFVFVVLTWLAAVWLDGNRDRWERNQ